MRVSGKEWRNNGQLLMIFELDPTTLLHSYGYAALVIGAFMEGETIVLLAGVLAHQGYLSPVPAALCAFGGSLASDQLMFYLGRMKGNAILHRFPRLEKKAPKVRTFLARHETSLILGFRFIYGIRNITPILMGMSTVNQWKFLILNVFSAALWAASFITAGYFLGQALAAFLRLHPHADKAMLALIVVVACGIWLWRRNRRKS